MGPMMKTVIARRMVVERAAAERVVGLTAERAVVESLAVMAVENPKQIMAENPVVMRVVRMATKAIPMMACAASRHVQPKRRRQVGKWECMSQVTTHPPPPSRIQPAKSHQLTQLLEVIVMEEVHLAGQNRIVNQEDPNVHCRFSNSYLQHLMSIKTFNSQYLQAFLPT